MSELAPYFGAERVLPVVKAMLDPYIWIAQTEFKIIDSKTAPLGNEPPQFRRYHLAHQHDYYLYGEPKKGENVLKVFVDTTAWVALINVAAVLHAYPCVESDDRASAIDRW